MKSSSCLRESSISSKQCGVLSSKFDFLLSNVTSMVVNICTSAAEMWNKLHSVFEQRTEQHQDRLFNEFFRIRQRDTHNIAKHMEKLEKLWVELQDETWKEDKVKLHDSFVNCVILVHTLSEVYYEFVNAWESVPKQERTATFLRRN